MCKHPVVDAGLFGVSLVAAPETAARALEETLAVLGCDAQALHGMVYPRLPNTWREGKRMGKLDREGKPVNGPNGRRVMTFVPFRDGRAKQALLYFNPSPERGRCIQEGVVFERAER